MAYKVGDRVGKYTITSQLGSKNGGQGECFLGLHEDKEFFIKRFLKPIYPGADFPGSLSFKEGRLKACKKFEAKHQYIQEALAAYGEDGFVVKNIDFFKHENKKSSHYFKVCRKVNIARDSEAIHLLPVEQRLFIMLTASFALKILHDQKIIHLDIKPDNILIQKYGNQLIAKIIDFDDSSIEIESLTPENVVGDFAYYSPEVANYVNQEEYEPFCPGSHSDIFSLGLVFSQYWTGKLPFDPIENCTYASDAAQNGMQLSVIDGQNKSKRTRVITSPSLRATEIEKIISTDSCSASQEVGQLIDRMLLLNPDKRPSSTDIHLCLKRLCHKYLDSAEEGIHIGGEQNVLRVLKDPSSRIQMSDNLTK